MKRIFLILLLLASPHVSVCMRAELSINTDSRQRMLQQMDKIGYWRFLRKNKIQLWRARGKWALAVQNNTSDLPILKKTESRKLIYLKKAFKIAAEQADKEMMRAILGTGILSHAYHFQNPETCVINMPELIHNTLLIPATEPFSTFNRDHMLSFLIEQQWITCDYVKQIRKVGLLAQSNAESN